MTEANYSFTTKTNGDLFTVRGNTIDEFVNNLVDAHAAHGAVRSLQGMQSSPVITTPNTHEEAAYVIAAAGMNPQVIQTSTPSIEVLQDRYGNEWTYGHPDAPDLPDGRGKYAKKKGVSKAGKSYTGWFDPAKGPKPFKPGAVEAETIWAK